MKGSHKTTNSNETPRSVSFSDDKFRYIRPLPIGEPRSCPERIVNISGHDLKWSMSFLVHVLKEALDRRATGSHRRTSNDNDDDTTTTSCSNSNNEEEDDKNQYLVVRAMPHKYKRDAAFVEMRSVADAKELSKHCSTIVYGNLRLTVTSRFFGRVSATHSWSVPMERGEEGERRRSDLPSSPSSRKRIAARSSVLSSPSSSKPAATGIYIKSNNEICHNKKKRDLDMTLEEHQGSRSPCSPRGKKRAKQASANTPLRKQRPPTPPRRMNSASKVAAIGSPISNRRASSMTKVRGLPSVPDITSKKQRPSESSVSSCKMAQYLLSTFPKDDPKKQEEFFHSLHQQIKDAKHQQELATKECQDWKKAHATLQVRFQQQQKGGSAASAIDLSDKPEEQRQQPTVAQEKQTQQLVESLQADLKAANESHESELEALFESHQIELTVKDQTAHQLQDQVSVLEAVSNQRQDTLIKIHEDWVQVTQEKSGLAEQVESLQTQVDTLNTQYTTLKTEHETLQLSKAKVDATLEHTDKSYRQVSTSLALQVQQNAEERQVSQRYQQKFKESHRKRCDALRTLSHLCPDSVPAQNDSTKSSTPTLTTATGSNNNAHDTVQPDRQESTGPLPSRRSTQGSLV